ncbi:MAG: efflux RND transporter periplasmic adaptor subunit [Acidobacteriota bacterium]
MNKRWEPSKRKMRFIWISAIVFIVLFILYFALRREKITVDVAEVKKGDVEYTITATTKGTIQADNAVVITPMVAGEVSRILVDIGDRVSRGDLLMMFDRKEAESQYYLALANLKNARVQLEKAEAAGIIRDAVSDADYEKAKAAFEKAEGDWKKFLELHTSGIISDQQLEQAKLEYRVAKTAYEAALAGLKQKEVAEQEIKAARALVEQMEAAFETAKINLDRTEIKAPFDGVIGERFAQLGQKVNPNTPLFTLVGGDVYVRASFDEVDVANIRPGQKVRIRMDSFPDEDFKGEVHEISPIVSMDKLESRTSIVKIRFLNNNERIRHGMSADAEILVDSKKDILFIPTDSIMIKKGQQYVYVLEKNKVVKREIEAGISNWDRTEITRGIKLGEKVITSLDVENLQEGARVKIK